MQNSRSPAQPDAARHPNAYAPTELSLDPNRYTVAVSGLAEHGCNVKVMLDTVPIKVKMLGRRVGETISTKFGIKHQLLVVTTGEEASIVEFAALQMWYERMFPAIYDKVIEAIKAADCPVEIKNKLLLGQAKLGKGKSEELYPSMQDAINICRPDDSIKLRLAAGLDVVTHKPQTGAYAESWMMVCQFQKVFEKPAPRDGGAGRGKPAGESRQSAPGSDEKQYSITFRTRGNVPSGTLYSVNDLDRIFQRSANILASIRLDFYFSTAARAACVIDGKLANYYKLCPRRTLFEAVLVQSGRTEGVSSSFSDEELSRYNIIDPATIGVAPAPSAAPAPAAPSPVAAGAATTRPELIREPDLIGQSGEIVEADEGV